MINSRDLVESVASHAATSGQFESVNQHEPKSSPGTGIYASVWAASIGPAGVYSGLAVTSAYVVLNLRIYTNMLAEPQDMIDPNIMDATDDLMARYSGDFTLDGLAMAVDLLGMGSETLSAEAGYLQIGGEQAGMYRVMTIKIPMIIENAWVQAP